MTRPGYPAYRNILASLGRQVVELACGPAERFQPSVEMLEQAHAAAPLAGLVVASPANPTRDQIAPDHFAKLAAWCVVIMKSDWSATRSITASPTTPSQPAAHGSTIVRPSSFPRSQNTGE